MATSDLIQAAQAMTRIPVENRNTLYTKFIDQWKRCRDVSDGKDAVHAAGEKYLPRLREETDDDYKARVQRAGFFNATWRTICGMQGMLFRVPPKVVVPDSVKPLLDNIDLKGTPFMLQLVEIAEEALKIGRLGLLVDYPVVVVDGLTKADAVAQNLRPTMALYYAESIIDWQTRNINNRTVLFQVRLEECKQVSTDEFTTKEQKQWRVLDLVNITNTETSERSVAYRVRIFTKDERGFQQQVGKDIYPTMDGKTLNYIPFYFIGTDSNSWEPDTPPMIDLVDLNLDYYRVKADYEHGCHFTGLPTPYIAGHKAREDKNGNTIEKFYIGSNSAWVFPDPLTNVGYLEFTGQGLSALKDNLEAKKKEMAVLGARLLEEQQRMVESAESQSMRHQGEDSMLSTISQSISVAIEAALITFVRWAGVPVPDDTDDGGGSDDKKELVDFELNREFLPLQMDAMMLTALVGAWQKSAISFSTLFDNLQRRDIVPRDATAEDEQARIDSEGPKLGALGTFLSAGFGGPGSPSGPPDTPKPPPEGTKPPTKAGDAKGQPTGAKA